VSELIAFLFRDQYRGPEVLNELRRREWPWVRDLDDAVVITLNEHGKARAQLNIDLSTYEAVGWARLWSSLLDTTLFLPLAEVIIDAADGIALPERPLRTLRQSSDETRETGWWRDSLEHSENFKRDVGALMSQSGSAIFMLLRSADATKVLRQLGNYGDTFVHTSISPEQDDKMHAMLGDR
jgi:uncharacterized membrane protein